jgi:hypothetical protein
MKIRKWRDSDKDCAVRLTQVNSIGRDGTMAKVAMSRAVVLTAVQAQRLDKVGK